MKNKTSVSEIMTKDVFALDADDTIGDVEEAFRNHSLRHAPVVSYGELVGMLSLVDVKSRGDADDQEGYDSFSITVKHLMTPDPVCVQIDTTVLEAAALFTENDFHAIPVLDGDRVVGIVSTTDVIKFFLESFDD